MDIESVGKYRMLSITDSLLFPYYCKAKFYYGPIHPSEKIRVGIIKRAYAPDGQSLVYKEGVLKYKNGYESPIILQRMLGFLIVCDGTHRLISDRLHNRESRYVIREAQF